MSLTEGSRCRVQGHKMYRQEHSNGAAAVRLPPLPRRPKTHISVVEEVDASPWSLDNPALRQLSTQGSKSLRNRSRASRRSFRSSKVTLPDIHGRKPRPTGSARSMRSNFSSMSSATFKSTRSLDMFRYNIRNRPPSSIVSAPLLQIPSYGGKRPWKTPGSAVSSTSVSTIPLPPIGINIQRTNSREDIASTVIPDDDIEEDDAVSEWPGAGIDCDTAESNIISDAYVTPGVTDQLPDDHRTDDTSLRDGTLDGESIGEEQDYEQVEEAFVVRIRKEKHSKERPAAPRLEIDNNQSDFPLNSHRSVAPSTSRHLEEIVNNNHLSQEARSKTDPLSARREEEEPQLPLSYRSAFSSHAIYQNAPPVDGVAGEANTANQNIPVQSDSAEVQEGDDREASPAVLTKDPQDAGVSESGDAWTDRRPSSRGHSGIKVTGCDAPEVTPESRSARARRRSGDEDEATLRELPTEKQIKRVFAGDFRLLPPMTKTSVRIFFWASPFRFHEEREWIQAKCQGTLQSFCADRGLDFHLVDLHLPGYDHLSPETFDLICRDQLLSCQRLSAGPTVIALIDGDDLPRSLPASMSVTDFETVRDIVDRKGLAHRKLLDTCYHLLPVEGETETYSYQLQNPATVEGEIGSQDDEEDDVWGPDGMGSASWAVTAVRLRELFRKTLVTAVVEGKITKDKAKAYLESDVSDQVRQAVGAYPTQSLCYIRQHLDEIEAATQATSEQKDTSVESSSYDAANMLGGRLRVDLSKRLNFLEYPLEQQGSHGRAYNLQPLRGDEAEPANLSQQRRTYLNRLCDDIVSDVKRTTQRAADATGALERAWAVTPLHAEVLHHARLCASRAAAFRGPDSHLHLVRDYLLDANNCVVPLVISGGADKNKSKLMARVGRLVRQWIQPRCAVVIRFLGTSPNSGDIKRVLIGIIYQICTIYEMRMPRVNDLIEFDRTVACFHAVLASVAMNHAAARPLVVMFDCLEKLTSLEGNHTAAWMPQLCPPNVFMVSSVASDSQHLLDTLRVKLTETKCFISLDRSLSSRPPAQRSGLGSRSHRSVFSGHRHAAEDLSTCSESGSTQDEDDDQEEEEEMEGNGEGIVTSGISWRVKPKRGVRLVELVSRRLDRLEQRHGELVMSWLLSYLAIGEGLTEVELLDALSCNTEVMEEVYIGSDVPPEARRRFPQRLWAQIRRDIFRFLEERLIDDKVVLSFGDEQVQETVESRYLNEDRLCECCCQLADLLRGFDDGALYDDGEDDDDDENSPKKSVAPQPLICQNRRKLRRLPVLLYRCGTFDAVRDTIKSGILCNFKWILTKLQALQFRNVMADYDMIKDSDSDIEFIRDLLMMCKTVIGRDPEKLGAEVVARLTTDSCHNRPFIRQFLSDAQDWFTRQTSGFYLVPKFPCLDAPSGYLKRRIDGPWHVLGTCGNLLILWGRETGLEVWNSTTTDCLHHLSNPFTWEDSLVSRDRRVVYQTCDTRLMGWDVHTAKKVCDVDLLPAVADTGRRQNPNMDDSFLSPLDVSEDRLLAAVRINKPEMLLNDKGLIVVDLNRETVVGTVVEAMGDRLSNCKFTPDGHRLIVTETQIMPGEKSMVHVYDCLTLELMGEQTLDPRYTIVPDSLYLTPDGTKFVVGCRPDNFLTFKVSDCLPLFPIPEPPGDEEMVRFVDMRLLPGDTVVMLSVDITQSTVLRKCSLSGEVLGPVMTSTTGRPKFVEISTSQSLAMVGFLEVGAIDLWDLEAAILLYTIRGHVGHVTSAALSSGCRLLYIGATDGTITVWNADDMLIAKGREVREFETPVVTRSSAQRPLQPPQSTHRERSLIPEDVDDIEERNSGDSLVDDDEGCIADDESSQVSESTFVAEHGEVETLQGVASYYTMSCSPSRAESETDSDQTDEVTTIVSQSDLVTVEQEDMLSEGGPRVHPGSGLISGRSHRGSGASKRSAQSSRQKSSAPAKTVAEMGFVNKTIQEDEVDTGQTPAIDIQNLVEGRLAVDGVIASNVTVAGGPPSARSSLAPNKERDSTATTARSSDTNTRLEEIFRKLDQQDFDTSIRLGSTEREAPITTVLGHQGETLGGQQAEIREVNDFMLAGDGRHFVTCHRKGAPILWNLDTAHIVHRMETPWDTGATTEIILAPDGRKLFGISRLGFEAARESGYENCLRVWDLETGMCYPMPPEPLYADAFNVTPDKTKLVLLRKRDNGTRFVVLDAYSLEKLAVGEVACELRSPYFLLTSDVAFIVTCDPGVKVTIWDVGKEDEYGVSRHVELPIATIPPAMVIADHRRLLVGTGYGSILHFDLQEATKGLLYEADKRLRLIPDKHQGEVLCLELSTDRTLLVSSSSDRTMKVIEVNSRSVRHILRGHKDMITCVSLSRDNELVCSGSHDNTIRIWSIETGLQLTLFYTYDDVFNIGISQESKTVVCLVDQQKVRKLIVCDLVKGNCSKQQVGSY